MSKWEYTETELWRHGEGEVTLYHVFGLISFGHTVLAFAEARYGRGDDAGEAHDIVMRRSEDGGRSFEPSVTLISGEGRHCYTNPTPVYEVASGKLFLFYCDNIGNSHTENFVVASSDGGHGWTQPQSLSDELNSFSAPLTFHLFGPGHGIQLRGGAFDGRLLMPVWHRKAVDAPLEQREYCASLIMSDDNGETWRQMAPFTGRICRANESRIAQTADGSLLWMLRPAVIPCRWSCRSVDGGETWTEPTPMSDGPAANCDAGLIGLSCGNGYEDTVVLSRISRLDRRENMELLFSRDGGRTFTGRMSLPPGDAIPGYSDLTVLAEEEPVLGLLHCRYNHVLFSRVSVQALTAGAYEKTKRNVWL